MLLRLLTAAVFCGSMLIAVPALQADADTAYLTVITLGNNPTATPGTQKSRTEVVVRQQYELDDFFMTLPTPTPPGSPVQASHVYTFSATTPANHGSDALLTLTNLIPALSVQLSGTSATETYAFTGCTESSVTRGAGSASLTFSCTRLTTTSTSTTAPAAPTTKVAPRAIGLHAYLDFNGTPIHITSFALDPASQPALSSMPGMSPSANAGGAAPSTMQFTLPLDGSGAALAALAKEGAADAAVDRTGKGVMGSPLTVTIVRSGDPITRPVATLQFSSWTIYAMTGSYSTTGAATDFLIRYGSERFLTGAAARAAAAATPKPSPIPSKKPS